MPPRRARIVFYDVAQEQVERMTSVSGTNAYPQHSEAHLTWSLISLMTRRITRACKPRTNSWSKKTRHLG
ncbi:hypothetical protein ACFUNF_22705 [Streptomyces sp. NPDC057291]|uniref:hypothetical protein n=1 Tax=Streptomyces sp. NPDC057291 TaxID=3346087 RepID=UPI0036276B7B